MAKTIACPRCKRAGYVRVETVIRAGKSEVTLWCGACDFHWSGGKDNGKRGPRKPPAR